MDGWMDVEWWLADMDGLVVAWVENGILALFSTSGCIQVEKGMRNWGQDIIGIIWNQSDLAASRGMPGWP